MNIADLLDPASTARKLAIGLTVALALAVLLGWLFWSRASLKADLATAEANVATLQGANRAKAKTIEDMKSASRAMEKALEGREAALNTISAQREALRLQLVEVLKNDPTARDWAARPLPDSVRRLLQ